MASAIQRFFVLFAFIAAGIAFVTPADASVAAHNPAWTDAAIASPAGIYKAAANSAIKQPTQCARSAGRPHDLCKTCSKFIVLRSAYRIRDKIQGLKQGAVTGIRVHEQLATASKPASRSHALARLAFQQTEFASGDVLTRTGRLRI